jgi:hypothetical protein
MLKVHHLGATPMPTLKPRVSITMEPEDLSILDRYAAASGTPRATIVSGLLASAMPELLRASELIELANAAPRHVRQGIVENLSNATADALGFLEPFHADFHQAMNHLQKELPIDPAKRREGSAAGPPRRASDSTPRRRNRPSDPHSLTGGSKP